MSNVSRYEVVAPSAKTGKVNPLHVQWAEGRKLALDGLTCAVAGAEVKVADGTLTKAEANAAVAHVACKVLTEAGLKVAKDAAATGEHPELRKALEIAYGAGKFAPKKPKATETTQPQTDEAAQPAA